MARGYRNRPDLTAERFIPDPFRGGKGRLYRTGDRVRFLPGGDLEYLGRVDGQIKLRGFRVEPGEIETALRGITGVREAVVRAREDVAGETRLVAYVVLDPGRARSVSDLRRLLKEILPAHMVPSNFVLLDALPRTPNGKLDVAALPAPESARPEVDNAYRGPETPVEKALMEIWMKALRVDRVGIDDNFFDLGGHSLLATQVVSRIRDAFHVELPLRDLFLNPTVAGLALAVVGPGRAVAPAEMESLLSELESHGNGRRAMSADPDRESAMSDFSQRIARLSLEARGILERRLQESSVGAVEQSIPRRRGGGPVAAFVCRGASLVFDRLDPASPLTMFLGPIASGGAWSSRRSGALGHHPGAPRALRSVSGDRINPAQAVGPLVALAVGRRSPRLCADGPRCGGPAHRRRGSPPPLPSGGWDLCCEPLAAPGEGGARSARHIHHIVFDDGSSDIVDDELAALYEAYRGGRPSPLAPLRFSTRILPCGSGSGCGGSARRGAFLLEGTVEGAPAVLELPTVVAPSGADFPGRDGDGGGPRSVARGDPGLGPAGGGNALHDAARGLPGAAPAPHRAGRHRRRFAGRGARSQRDRRV